MHQLKIILRKAQQEKLLTSLKLISLFIGFSVALIIFSWVTNEFNKNKSVKEGDQIYRLAYTWKNNQGTEDSYVGNAPWSPILYQELPEVSDYTRYSGSFSATLQHQQQRTSGQTFFADSTFLSFWGMELLACTQTTPLSRPFTAVITESLATKLFRSGNAIGQQVQLNNDYPVTVTGIVKEVADDFTIPFDFLISFATIDAADLMYTGWDGGDSFRHYLKLVPHSDPIAVAQKIMPLFQKHYDYQAEEQEDGLSITPYLQPLNKVYLDYSGASIRQKIYLMLLTAGLILMVSAFNYTFISLSSLLKKNIHKAIPLVFGESRRKSALHLLLESLIYALMAAFVSLAVLPLALPLMETTLNMKLSWQFLSVNFWLIVASLILLITSLGALFPVIQILSGKITHLLSGIFSSFIPTKYLRGGLLIFQLGIATGILLFTLTIIRQTQLLQNKELGFKQENLVYIKLPANISNAKAMGLCNQIRQVTRVNAATLSSEIPLSGYPGNGFELNNNGQWMSFRHSHIDSSFLSTLDIKLLKGKNLLGLKPHDIIINQALANYAGWADPLNGVITRNGQTLNIVGVVEDFHMSETSYKIEPLVLNAINAGWVEYLTIQLAPGDQLNTIEHIKNNYRTFMKEDLAEVHFYSSELDQRYRYEIAYARQFIFFAALVFTVTLLGLFAFIYFSTQQRTKEIGIRKVHGARTREILIPFWKNGLFLLLPAIALGVLTAYPIITDWLNQYPYRVAMDGLTIAVTAAIVGLVTFITITWQIQVAASKNPIKCLRYE